MVPSLKELISLVPPPTEPVETGSIEAWKEIEERIGLELPSDYKQIVNLYGTGAWGNFLWIFNPFSKNEFLNLEKYSDKMHDAFRQRKKFAPDEIPFEIYPESNGIYSWAVTDNGDMLFWLTEGPSNSWEIIIWESRGPEYDRLNLSVSEFLIKWLTNERKISVFPLYDPFIPSFDTPDAYYQKKS